MTATLINWADLVWNFLIGCDRCSAGCDACYAIMDAWMRAENPDPKIAAANAGLTYRNEETGRPDWTGDVRFLPERLDKPLRTINGQRWFVNSKSDLFHARVKAEWIAQALAIMAACPRHTFLTLTKRHSRMRSLMTSPAFRRLYEDAYAELAASLPPRRRHEPLPADPPWPIPGLHLGVSAEDQDTAELRIPDLLRCRDAAGVLWVSVEPQITLVDLRHLRVRGGAVMDALAGTMIGPIGDVVPAPGVVRWVVDGGESGPIKATAARTAARRAELEWFEAMRDDCAATGTAYWLKQLGTQAARELGVRGPGSELADLPADLAIRELPRAA